MGKQAASQQAPLMVRLSVIEIKINPPAKYDRIGRISKSD
jgi:hypothetical protein